MFAAGLAPRRRNFELARHAQMDDECAAVVQTQEHVFAAAAKALKDSSDNGLLTNSGAGGEAMVRGQVTRALVTRRPASCGARSRT